MNLNFLRLLLQATINTKFFMVQSLIVCSLLWTYWSLYDFVKPSQPFELEFIFTIIKIGK